MSRVTLYFKYCVLRIDTKKWISKRLPSCFNREALNIASPKCLYRTYVFIHRLMLVVLVLIPQKRRRRKSEGVSFSSGDEIVRQKQKK